MWRDFKQSLSEIDILIFARKIRGGESNKKYKTSSHGKKYDDISRTYPILPRLSFLRGQFATATYIYSYFPNGSQVHMKIMITQRKTATTG